MASEREHSLREFRYWTITPPPPTFPTRWHHPLRYAAYVVGVRVGGPPNGNGRKTTPLDFTEWKAWFTRGY